MKKNTAERPITLSGVVTAAKWDIAGRVTAVTISATDEQEYIVSNTPVGEQLLERVQEQVQVVGAVKKNKEGKKQIEVTQFKVIREYENEHKNSVFLV